MENIGKIIIMSVIFILLSVSLCFADSSLNEVNPVSIKGYEGIFRLCRTLIR